MNKTVLNFNEYEKNIITDPKDKKSYRKITKFERKKYYKYLKILSQRLNNIHKNNYQIKFWNKILFYFLLIHITQCDRIFRNKNKILRIKKVKYIKFKKFYIPNCQNDHRNLFHKSIVGQEKLFGTLIKSLKNKIKIPVLQKDNLLIEKIERKKKNYYFNFIF